MKRKRFLLVLLSALMITVLLVGCGGGAKDSVPSDSGDSDKENIPGNSEEKILYLTSNRTAGSGSPHLAISGPDFEITRYIVAKPYTYLPNDDGSNAQIGLELAANEPENPSGDGKTWNIKINQDAKWANGEPINADTFIYSYKMILDPILLAQPASLFANNYIEIENASKYNLQVTNEEEIDWEDVGIKKLDDHTLEITTTREYTKDDVMKHLALRSAGVVYEPMYEEHMNTDRTATLYGSEPDKIMSAGAFVLDKWIKGSERTFKRNSEYILADLVKLDEIRYRVIEDSGTGMQLFENGEIDFIQLNADGISRYEEDPRVISSPSRIVRQIDFNIDHPDKPILGNLNFRKAIFYGIDRETVADFTNLAPANYYVAHTSEAYADGTLFRDLPGSKEYLPENYGYDPDKAVECFNKALAEEGLKKVEVTLNYVDAMEEVKMISEYMQKSLTEIFGQDKFKLNLQAMPNNQLLDAMKSHGSNPDSFEISWTGWGWSAGDFSPNRTFEVMQSTFGRKNAPYNNKRFDELYLESLSDEVRLDEKKKAEITMELEKVYIEEVLAVPVIEVINQYIVSDRLILAIEKDHSGLSWGYEFMDIE